MRTKDDNQREFKELLWDILEAMDEERLLPASAVEPLPWAHVLKCRPVLAVRYQVLAQEAALLYGGKLDDPRFHVADGDNHPLRDRFGRKVEVRALRRVGALGPKMVQVEDQNGERGLVHLGSLRVK